MIISPAARLAAKRDEAMKLAEKVRKEPGLVEAWLEAQYKTPSPPGLFDFNDHDKDN
jgi:hypothetical protein